MSALTAYAAAQDAVLLNLPITETFDTIDVTCPVTDLTQALSLASTVVREGGLVSIELVDPDDSEQLTLRSDQVDEWTLGGALNVFYGQLADREAPDRWQTADLASQSPDVQFGATATMILNKEKRVVVLSEQTGRSIWLGLSTSAFVDWIRRTTWTGPLNRLFAKPGATVLLSDWAGEPAVLGPRMTVGGLDTPSDPPPVDSSWPEAVPPEMLRVLDVDFDAARPPELRTTLAGLVGASSAWLLSEERGLEQSRPSRRSATRWEIGKDPSRHMADATAIVELARWVARDPNLTRLEIARQIAATRILDASKAQDAAPLLEAADISYQTAIDDTVQKALQSQLELERSFQDLDSKLGDLRDTLRRSVDSTIIRTLTASLGIVIAALTVADARGWPTVLASAAVAAYVLFAAWWSLRTMRTDFTVRLEALGKLIQARAVGLGDDLGTKIDKWKTALKNRVIAAQVALTVVAVIVAAGGAALGLSVGRHSTTPPSDRGGTPTPASIQPTPSHS